MILISCLLLFASALLLYAYSGPKRKKGLPPGPKPLPFIGNLKLAYKNDYFHKTLQDLSFEYGGIYSLQMGTQPTIVISDFGIMQEAMIDKAAYFSDRPMHLTLVKLLFRGNGLAFQNGEKWDKIRKLVLSSMRNFGVGKSKMEECIEDEVSLLIQNLEETKGKAFRMRHFFHIAVCNVVCSLLFSKRFDHDDKEFTTLLDDLTYLLGNGDFQNLGVFLNLLGLISATILHPSILFTLMSNLKTRGFAKRRLAEHRRAYDPDRIADFLDMYLNAEANSHADPSYTDAMIFQSIMDLFLAGTESTSTTLVWFFFFMIKYPEIQAKCREEILREVGSNRSPTMKDKDSMPYLTAATNEVLRIGMAAPIGAVHNTSKDTTLGEYVVPKDTVVITNIYGVHMNENYWPDPFMFKPERFLDENGDLLRNVSNFMPFGIGKRKCLGDNLAKTELFLITANLLQRFEFLSKDSQSLPDIQNVKIAINLIPPQYSIIARTL